MRSGLVELAVGSSIDPESIEVTTQHSIAGVGRLDLFLVGPRLRVIVESKLGSGWGHDQLGRYLRWLGERRDDAELAGLLTLTRRAADWPKADVDFANARGIAARPARWEDLHQLLEERMEQVQPADLSNRIVRDFLDMLAAEDLVPVRALTPDDLGPAWADAWSLVRHYRDFFRACKTHVGAALCARPSNNAWTDSRADLFYQDYEANEGRIVFGFFYTDENEKLRPHLKMPILWIGAKSERSDSHEVAHRLADVTPPGWTAGTAWNGRPTIWRYLSDVLRGGTSSEEQLAAVATAAGEARAWFDEALAFASAATAQDIANDSSP